jgi:hypothetical protein
MKLYSERIFCQSKIVRSIIKQSTVTELKMTNEIFRGKKMEDDLWIIEPTAGILPRSPFGRTGKLIVLINFLELKISEAN